MRPRTEECIIFTIDSGLETPFKILADSLGSGRDRTRGGRRVRQTHWIVTRPSEVSGKERATREAISVAMRNWKVGVWRGDNSATRANRMGEAGWILVSGNNWQPEYRTVGRDKIVEERGGEEGTVILRERVRDGGVVAQGSRKGDNLEAQGGDQKVWQTGSWCFPASQPSPPSSGNNPPSKAEIRAPLYLIGSGCCPSRTSS